MNYYQKRKEQVRQEAIDWQYEFANKNYYMSALCEWHCHFAKLGKRYGLLRVGDNKAFLGGNYAQ